MIFHILDVVRISIADTYEAWTDLKKKYTNIPKLRQEQIHRYKSILPSEFRTFH